MKTHPKPGDTIDSGDVEDLRQGTILKTAAQPYPIRVGYQALIMEGKFLGLSEIHEYGSFLVLWVPPVEAPKIGEKVSLEQLDVLADDAVVLTSGHRALQKINALWYETGQDSWRHVGDLTQDVHDGLTLLWLPQDGGKA